MKKSDLVGLSIKREPYRYSLANGTVKFFNQSRGFGFVTPEDGSKDVFVHVTALEAAGIPSIDEGDKITFDIEDDQRGRGKQATNVKLAQ